MKKRFILLAVLTMILSGMALLPQKALAQTAPTRIEITAKRFTFEPNEITVKKGQPVVLVLKSLDVSHGLHIRELNVSMKVSKGGTSEVQFTPEQIGDFVGHCAVFCGMGHGSMMLTIHVVE